jgi:AraC-like DNA-binding protein
VHDANGQLIYGSSTLSPKQCRFAAQETLRWGETTIHYNKTCGKLYWSVPLMLNNQLIGGLAVCEVPFGDEATSEERLTRIRKAATGLLDLTVRENFIAESTLREALERSRTEQEKAEAIHLLKNRFYTSIQTVYTEKEPALLSAIRRGEREEAIQMLNEIFVVIYHYGASSQELLKSYLLELVAMMSRAAVEAGSQTENALGLNFQSITQLAALEDDEAIAAWLSDILERLFTQIQSNRDHPHSVAFNKAFSYMDAHLSDNLKREDVARHVGLSSSHFAHLLSTYTGKSFRKILTELRVEKAAQLLRHSQLSLTEIAFECGFSDQSHFSRVFSKATSHSPGDYRKQGIQLPNLE